MKRQVIIVDSMFETETGSEKDKLMKIAIWSVIIACIIFLGGIIILSI